MAAVRDGNGRTGELRAGTHTVWGGGTVIVMGVWNFASC